MEKRLIRGEKNAQKLANQDHSKWMHEMSAIRGSAQSAWDSGRVFYVVKLSLGGTTAGFMSQSAVAGEDVTRALQTIEAVGWRLDDAGYVYQPLKERSSALTDSAHLSGNIVGVYTFRRPALGS